MMPAMRKAPEKLFSKMIITKVYGFNTPQDGSVCKIKVISDEANVVSGLDVSSSKDIVVGDVDDPVDMIIEDCIRTMKEKEVCCIEIFHPDFSPKTFIFCENSEDCKEMNDFPTGIELDCENNPPEIDDSQPEATSAVETAKDNLRQNRISYLKTEEINEDSCNNNSLPKMVEIQFQLLSYTRELEIWEVSIAEKWRRASYHKQKGLELYSRGMYQYAFKRFCLTLKYVISLERDVTPGQEEGMDLKGLKLTSYLNMAACQMKSHNFESVVINSSKALNLQPDNAKALYRRGAAYLQLQEYERAKEDLSAAQQLEPKNQAIAKQLHVLKSHVQKLNSYYASAMKKMFS